MTDVENGRRLLRFNRAPASGERRTLHVVDALGFALLGGGLLGWLWLGDWRWAVTGLVLLILSTIVAASIRPRER